MFASEYDVLGQTLRVICIARSANIIRETDVYKAIERVARPRGWRYYRVENKLQNGFPDITVFKGQQYWFIEAKKLRRKTFQSPVDDLKWQPGQLDFLLRALASKSNYMLAVGVSPNYIAYLAGVCCGPDLPDFIAAS